ncbi:hypothetical protein RJ55_04692 [Drechmeria coniospora]|nr:hypothetical protein RJ55_04692 [Drechmeria coniospora]
MICPHWLAILWLGIIGATSAWAAENATVSPAKLVAGAFILECESGQICESVAKAVEKRGGTLRRTFNSDVFHGISVQLSNLTAEEDKKALVAQFKGIKGTWPVQGLAQSSDSTAKSQPEDKLEEKSTPGQGRGELLEKRLAATPKTYKRHKCLRGRAEDDHVESPWNHLMTHVDKLHKEGYMGSGIKIAVVDTGVDYNHPALGGCFGPACKVATGDNFSNEGDKGDPLDCHGHGTIVASILAGHDKAKGFVGVAPNATIMAYRVLNCRATGSEDDMIAGWLKAKEDGAQIIISSSGFEGQNWAQRPLAMVASRIVASGVPCIVGLGNMQNEGLFFTLNPATGRGVTAVNSFARTDVALEDRGTYSIGNRSEPVEFMFAPGWRGPRDWDKEWRPLHDVDADFGDKPDDDLMGGKDVPIAIDDWTYLERNCKLSPGNSSNGFDQDLVGRIALIRQTPETKNCNFYDRVRNAVARGAAHILAWQDDPTYVMVERKDAKRVRAIGITGSDVGRAMARALAASAPVTARRIGRMRIETGYIAARSAYGPTWDMDIKPNVGAPGQDVPVAYKDGGYGSQSGTSYAGPLVAGVLALMAEVRGTFDPALLNSLLMSTAEPQNEDGRPITVVQQGGGLVKAWEAAHATTLVEPGALTFNDTDNRVRSIGLRITNTGKTEVTYQLSNLAATTLYTFASGSIRPSSGEAVNATANIKLSQTSVVVGPGQSVTVDVSAADPSGLDAKRLPLWSGWVAIKGSDGRKLTVPYLGLGGSLRSATVLDPASALRTLANSEFVLPDPPNGQKPGPSGEIKQSRAAIRGPAISTEIDLVLGSPQLRVDIVPLDLCSASGPVNAKRVGSRAAAGFAKRSNTTELDLSKACVPDSMVTEVSGVKSIGQLPGYPNHHVKRGSVQLDWAGEFAPGQYAPPGRYKIVARALSIMGEAANEAHWQIIESPVFSISYTHNGPSSPKLSQSSADFWAKYFTDNPNLPQPDWDKFYAKNPGLRKPNATAGGAPAAGNSAKE